MGRNRNEDGSAIRLITGDECGLIKETLATTDQPDKGTPLDTNSANIHVIENPDYEQTRRHGICALTPFTASKNCNNYHDDDTIFRFASLRMSGVVELYENNSCDLTSKSASASASAGSSFHRSSVVRNVFSGDQHKNKHDNKHKPLGLAHFANENENDALVACDTAGNVSILKHNDDDDVSRMAYQVQTRLNVNENENNNENNNDAYTTVTAAPNSNSLTLTFGGRDRETFLYDVETQSVKWKAKNLPPDPQTLLQWPVWTTALQYMYEHEQSSNSNILAVGTAYTDRPLKIYDVRAQRKAVCYAKEGIMEHRITSLCDLSSSTICVGDAAGYIHCLDIRQMSRQYARFVGPGGSVRSIVRMRHKNMIACVSLDRMLRTYDITSRRCVHKVYLKQRLNCCMFAPVLQTQTQTQTQTKHRGRSMSEEEILRVGNWGKGEDEVRAYVDSSDDDDDDEEVITKKEVSPSGSSASTSGSTSGSDGNDHEDGDEDVDTDEGSSSGEEELSVASSLGSSCDEEEEEEVVPDVRHKRRRR
eukprot:CAMPEP_0116005924 /NCGR_PEP_ID=MMETSP0321-20121206/1437_1 /TAXON_ID=163516 /ORGANISM="Leptocylindrus danicus var. danicus, Strain B650" /LENGTH=533 /DNA_ID=CAMNT_0003474409 /DNA_START=5 /DNA_END=1606 /DNA_ORIENTATION=+